MEQMSYSILFLNKSSIFLAGVPLAGRRCLIEGSAGCVFPMIAPRARSGSDAFWRSAQSVTG
jgi:hypothetical protein